MLGIYGEDGALRYVGRVGTGFDSKLLHSLHARLKALEIGAPPFANPPRGSAARGAHWVKPVTVAEVSFAQWTEDGMVRHAVFHGFRADKAAAQIGRERPTPLESAIGKAGSVRGASKPTSRPATDDTVGGIRITHPERVIEKTRQITKIDLARYYESVEEWILPHLNARPVALLRAPDGIDNELFFQKHIQHLTIPGVQILDAKLDPGHEPLMMIGSLKPLIGAAQMGAIEFHTWNSTTKTLERPDRLVLDLDPDPTLSWKTVVEAATLTKALLDELGLETFVKTSGGKGLHIVLSLARRHTWDDVSAFSQAISRHLAATIPKRFSAKMGPQNRVKKVFVDYLRNRRGATTITAYSARARIGLPVSVPITWEELSDLRASDAWTIETLRLRLSELKSDPWNEYGKRPQILTGKAKQMLGLTL
jgi:bifunctional non-homologous end joining protein LigD